MDRWELFTAFVSGACVTLRTKEGATIDNGYIQAIEREDGSGNCWNVTYTQDYDDTRKTVFIRTR